MARQFVCVDLFSGLGGFSEAFLKSGWTVYRYDNDKQFAKVPCTHIVDVWDLTPEVIKGAHEEIDIMLISPPCNCFTPLTIGHYWKGGRPDKRAKVAITLVKRALWLKDQTNPRYWVLENPAGMLKYALGPPNILTWWAAWGSDYLKPTHLWGIMPTIQWPRRPRPGEYISCKRGEQKGIQGSGLTSAERALIPYDFSNALCVAIENDCGGQTSLAAFDNLPTQGEGCIVDKRVGKWGPYRYLVTKHKGKQHWKYLGRTDKFIGLVSEGG